MEATAFTDQGLKREVCVCVCVLGVHFKLVVLKAQHFKKASSSSLAR